MFLALVYMIWITTTNNINLGRTIVQNLVSEQNLKQSDLKECTAFRGRFLPCFTSDLNMKFTLHICIKKQTLVAKVSIHFGLGYLHFEFECPIAAFHITSLTKRISVVRYIQYHWICKMVAWLRGLYLYSAEKQCRPQTPTQNTDEDCT